MRPEKFVSFFVTVAGPGGNYKQNPFGSVLEKNDKIVPIKIQNFLPSNT